MRIAIMQPTYLPWIGYFALMNQVDTFVFLDNVQFSQGRSWQSRNRIKSKNGPLWLTVPIERREKSHQYIYETKIKSEESWQKKHYSTIQHNYAKAPSSSYCQPWLEKIYGSSWESLCCLNITLIENISELLGITVQFLHSSALPASKDNSKSSRLIDICQIVGADEYLSPIGAFEYINADNTFADAGIKLLYQHYEHPEYHQLHGEFLSHMSVIDLLLNEGADSFDIICSGNKTPYTHEEVRQFNMYKLRGKEEKIFHECRD